MFCTNVAVTVECTGLPDFSWYQNGENIPNNPKLYQWPQSLPNGRKIYQMATKYTKWPQNIPNGHKIYQKPQKYLHLPLQVPTKFTKIRIFCFTNMRSGNPAAAAAISN
jgi:hypothetical protein